MANEAAELDSLENAKTGLILTQDEKLPGVLNKLLPKLLIGLAQAPTQRVQKKIVSELLLHVNKRLASLSQPSLPLGSLVQLYSSNRLVVQQSHSSLARNLCAVYIERAAQCHTQDEPSDAVCTLLPSIAQQPAEHVDILLRVLCYFKHGQALEACDATACARSDLLCLLRFAETLVRMRPGVSDVPGGVSAQDSKRICWRGQDVPAADIVTDAKISLLKFVDKCTAKELSSSDRLVLYLLASTAAPEEQVKSLGEERLKRIAGSAAAASEVVEAPAVCQKLFELFDSNNIDNPPHPVLRSKIVQLLCKSRTAANDLPRAIEVIFEGIFSTNSSPMLLNATMEFLSWCLRICDLERLREASTRLHRALIQLLESTKTTESQRAQTLEAFAHLASRVPETVNTTTDALQWLLDMIEVEQVGTNLHSSAKEALPVVASAYSAESTTPGSVRNQVESAVLERLHSSIPGVRHGLLQIASKSLSLQSPAVTYAVLLLSDDPEHSVRDFAQRLIKSSSVGAAFEDTVAYFLSREQALAHGYFSTISAGALEAFLSYCKRVAQHEQAHRFTEDFQALLKHILRSQTLPSTVHITTLQLVLDWLDRNEAACSVFLKLCFEEQVLVQLLAHPSSEARDAASRLLGACSKSMTEAQLQHLIKTLSHSIQDPSHRLEERDGCIVALGKVISMSHQAAGLEECSDSIAAILFCINSDKWLRVSSLYAIGECSATATVPDEGVNAVLAFLNGCGPDVERKAAAWSCGWIACFCSSLEMARRLVSEHLLKLFDVTSDNFALAIANALGSACSRVQSEIAENVLAQCAQFLASGKTNERRTAAAAVHASLENMNADVVNRIDSMLPNLQAELLHCGPQSNSVLAQEEAEVAVTVTYKRASSQTRRTMSIRLEEGLAAAEGKLKELLLVANACGDRAMWYSLLEHARQPRASARKESASIEPEKLLSSRAVPQLYRIYFDPEQEVSDAAERIWLSLIGENPTDYVKSNFAAVSCDHCIQACSSPSPRHRSGAALALARLIPHLEWEIVKVRLRSLWQSAFKCVDDVSAMTRTSGAELISSTFKASVKFSTPSDTSHIIAKDAAAALIPIMVEDGMSSGKSSSEGSAVALGLLTKVFKTAPPEFLSAEQAAKVVPRLLLAIGEAEDPRAWRAQAIASSDAKKDTNEKIASTRATMATKNPLIEVVEEAIRQAGCGGADTLATQISPLLKAGHSSATRSAAAHSVRCLQQHGLSEAVAAKLAETCLDALLLEETRSGTISQVSALDIAMRFVNPEQHEKAVNRIVGLVDDPGDEHSCDAAALILRELGKSEQIKDYGHKVVPVAMLLQSEGNDWVDVMNSLAASGKHALRLHINDVCERIVHEIHYARQWARKRAAVRLAHQLLDEESTNASTVQALVNALVEELPRAKYNGREEIATTLGKGLATRQANINYRKATQALLSAIKKSKKDIMRPSLQALKSALETVDGTDDVPDGPAIIAALKDTALGMQQEMIANEDDACALLRCVRVTIMFATGNALVDALYIGIALEQAWRQSTCVRNECIQLCNAAFKAASQCEETWMALRQQQWHTSESSLTTPLLQYGSRRPSPSDIDAFLYTI